MELWVSTGMDTDPGLTPGITNLFSSAVFKNDQRPG